VRDELGKLRAECDRIGRDYGRLDMTIMKRELRGDRAGVQSGLREYEDAGAHRFVIMQIGSRMTSATYEAELQRLAALYLYPPAIRPFSLQVPALMPVFRV